MISFLEGEIVEKAGARVVVDVAGVGYDVLVPTSTLASLPPVGRRARIHTRMIVRDDAMLLYGFGSTDERELFDLLTGVTGRGTEGRAGVPVLADARCAPALGRRRRRRRADRGARRRARRSRNGWCSISATAWVPRAT